MPEPEYRGISTPTEDMIFGGSRPTDLWPGEVYCRQLDGKLYKVTSIRRLHGKTTVHYWDIANAKPLETTKSIFDKIFKIDLRSCTTCGRHPSACICVEESSKATE